MLTPPTICFDVDETICFTTNRDFANATPNRPLIDRMWELKNMGYKIVLSTARGTGRSKNQFWTVAADVIPELCKWLKDHNVPFDEIRFDKPWAAYYVDDKAITPEEFMKLSMEEFK